MAQPYIRPIVRGKSGKQTEFGAKISAGLTKGYVFLDYLGWDAYNEGTELIGQVERYKDRFGYYPEEVIGDTIYGTRENRKNLKELGIVFSGKTLGRPPNLTEQESKQARKRQKKREGLRNGIEGKFGEGKRKYDLDLVKTKTRETSESWIAAVFFVMNLAAWLRKNLILLFFKLFDIFEERWMKQSKLAFEYQS